MIYEVLWIYNSHRRWRLQWRSCSRWPATRSGRSWSRWKCFHSPHCNAVHKAGQQVRCFWIPEHSSNTSTEFVNISDLSILIFPQIFKMQWQMHFVIILNKYVDKVHNLVVQRFINIYSWWELRMNFCFDILRTYIKVLTSVEVICDIIRW